MSVLHQGAGCAHWFVHAFLHKQKLGTFVHLLKGASSVHRMQHTGKWHIKEQFETFGELTTEKRLKHFTTTYTFFYTTHAQVAKERVVVKNSGSYRTTLGYRTQTR